MTLHVFSERKGKRVGGGGGGGRSAIKSAYVVTSIKGSSVLSSHFFWVP